MGYTHYFEGLQPNEELAQDIQDIIANSSVSIKGWDGSCEPSFTQDSISFNGDASLGEDFETFRISQGDYTFNFCKTGRRPYDEVVGAFLMRAILVGAEGCDNIGSDGTFDDWQQSGAFELYEKTFGEISPDEWDKLKQVLRW